MSAIAANNVGTQDPVSSLLGGTFALATLIIFAVFYLVYLRCYYGTKQK